MPATIERAGAAQLLTVGKDGADDLLTLCIQLSKTHAASVRLCVSDG